MTLPHVPRGRLLLPALLLVGATALSACGGGDQVDLDPLRQSVEALDSAQGDLRSRMSDIEQSLTALGAADGSEDALAASGLLDQIDQIEQAVASIRADFDQFVVDDGQVDEELRGLIADLEATLNGVTTTLSGIRDDIANLREDHELLKQRFERHLQDHDG